MCVPALFTIQKEKRENEALNGETKVEKEKDNSARQYGVSFCFSFLFFFFVGVHRCCRSYVLVLLGTSFSCLIALNTTRMIYY